MNIKRKQVMDYLLDSVSRCDKTNKNTELLKKRFDKMSDEEFDKFMNDLKDNKDNIYLQFPNMDNNANLIDLKKEAERIGVVLMSQLLVYDEVIGEYYKTNEKYLILKNNVRRTIQYLDDKQHFSHSDKHTDQLSGQVISDDKAAKISINELYSLKNKGLDQTISELATIRGGNIQAYSRLKMEALEKGECSIETSLPGTKTKSVVTTSNLLYARHFDNNLLDNE
jgi:hypothetical protein